MSEAHRCSQSMLLGEHFHLHISSTWPDNFMQCLVLQTMVAKNFVWGGIPSRWRAIRSTMFRRILFFNKCFVGCYCVYWGHYWGCRSMSKECKTSHIFCHIICLQRCMEFRRNFMGFGKCFLMSGLVTQQKLLAADCDTCQCRLIHKPGLKIRSIHPQA